MAVKDYVRGQGWVMGVFFSTTRNKAVAQQGNWLFSFLFGSRSASSTSSANDTDSLGNKAVVQQRSWSFSFFFRNRSASSTSSADDTGSLHATDAIVQAEDMSPNDDDTDSFLASLCNDKDIVGFLNVVAGIVSSVGSYTKDNMRYIKSFFGLFLDMDDQFFEKTIMDYMRFVNVDACRIAILTYFTSPKANHDQNVLASSLDTAIPGMPRVLVTRFIRIIYDQPIDKINGTLKAELATPTAEIATLIAKQAESKAEADRIQARVATLIAKQAESTAEIATLITKQAESTAEADRLQVGRSALQKKLDEVAANLEKYVGKHKGNRYRFSLFSQDRSPETRRYISPRRRQCVTRMMNLISEYNASSTPDHRKFEITTQMGDMALEHQRYTRGLLFKHGDRLGDIFKPLLEDPNFVTLANSSAPSLTNN